MPRQNCNSMAVFAVTVYSVFTRIVRDPYTIFSNGAILNTNYTDMNSPNLIEYM